MGKEGRGGLLEWIPADEFRGDVQLSGLNFGTVSCCRSNRMLIGGRAFGGTGRVALSLARC